MHHTHTDLQTLPHGWRNLWRAEVESLPEAIGCVPFTIFVRAGGRDAAHLAIQRALHAMFPAAYQELDQAYCNLCSAFELVTDGLSERYVDRLFESAWLGDKVDGWVRAPVFVVPEAAALYAAWMTAQLDHSSQYASLAFSPAPGVDVYKRQLDTCTNIQCSRFLVRWPFCAGQCNSGRVKLHLQRHQR